MVKNQNWQRRVETADARRRLTRQTKQQRQAKKTYKIQAEELLTALQDLKLCSKIKIVHIWTTAEPHGDKDKPDVQVPKRRRNRSSTIGEFEESPPNHQRLRSGSVGSANMPRKRSQSFGETLTLPPPRMCSTHFFGKCRDKACRRHMFHMETSECMSMTVRDAEQLERSARAHPTIDRAMERLYYIVIPIVDDGSSVANQVTTFLSGTAVGLATIVYAAIGDVLVFDRHRNGLLHTSQFDLMKAVLNRKNSCLRDDCLARQFPAAVLERILEFLPEQSICTLSLACKEWKSEIDSVSTHLFKTYLKRRNWPDFECAEHRRTPRDMFLEHFAVSREVRVLGEGLRALGTPRQNPCPSAACHDFSTRANAPRPNTECVGVEVWSENRVLAAYESDNSLRLFETSMKADGSKYCREVVCKSFDPFRSRRRPCRLMGICLDDELVVGQCLVSDIHMATEYRIIVSMSREAFLLDEPGSASNNENFNVLDRGCSVFVIRSPLIEFMTASDTGRRLFPQLLVFLESGGLAEHVEVIQSGTLLPFVKGCVVVEATVALPVEDGHTYLRSDKLYVVLSLTDIGSVLWVGECAPNRDVSDEVDDSAVFGESFRHHSAPTLPSLGNGVRSLVVGSATCPLVLIRRISERDQPETCRIVDISPSVQASAENVWHLPPSFRRRILVTSTHVVLADIMVKMHVSASFFISFFPIDAPDVTSPATVMVPDRLQVIQMIHTREHHLIVICSQVILPNRRARAHGDSTALLEYWALVYYLPTQSLIARQFLVRSRPPAVPLFTNTSIATLGASMGSSGVVMVGSNVRDFAGASGANATTHSRRKRSGKAKQPAKKDEYARGMRQSF